MNITGFEILEQVSESDIASVLKAHQISLDRIVAIKRFLPGSEVSTERILPLLQTAMASAKIKHPNLVQIYDVAEHEGSYLFVLEFIEGPTVSQVIRDQPGLSEKKALQIAACAAEALQEAWQKENIPHLGINPGNIMIDRDGTVKIADLGTSRVLLSENLARDIQKQFLRISPHYLAPEQALGNSRPDFATDMYGLGATLYHMVTGKAPFSDQADPLEVLHRQVNGTLPNPRQLNPRLSLGTTHIMARLMAKNPGDRFPDWPEVIREFDALLTGRSSVRKHADKATVSTISPLPSASSPRPASTGIKKKTVVPHTRKPQPSFPWTAVAWLGLALWWMILAFLMLRVPRAAGAENPPEAAVVAAEQESREILALKILISKELVGERYDEAVVLIERELEYTRSKTFHQEMDALKALIRQVSTLNRVLESNLRREIGKEITLQHKGKKIQIVIQSVAEGRVNADIITRVEDAKLSKPITFEISKLEPGERARWLGWVDTPLKSIMHYMLLMQAGDKETAGKISKKCGILSEALRILAQGVE